MAWHPQNYVSFFNNHLNKKPLDVVHAVKVTVIENLTANIAPDSSAKARQEMLDNGVILKKEL